jgi:uncharacterized protein
LPRPFNIASIMTPLVPHLPDLPDSRDLVARARDAAQLISALQAQLGATLIETHISWVLLEGVNAWKIKKPVQLPFLDFSELAARQRLCHDEWRLNRRLAPQLYLGVVPITGTSASPCLGGSGPVIEYALHMRRFADGALMAEHLAAGTLRPAHLDKLAVTLAAFHHAASHSTADTPYGSPTLITGATQAVLEGLCAHGGQAECAPLQSWLADQASKLRPLWLQRQAQGRVVEGHGDLHLANVVVMDEEVTAFDCIEFDPALRWVDVFSDIAFLMMDLMAHGRADLAWRFLNAYLDESGDYAGLPTLRYYQVYRALVRALVARVGMAQGRQVHGPDYLALAGRLMQPPGARLLITHGLSGSGKTFAAQALLASAGAIRVRSDIERKRLFGLNALADSRAQVPGGIYGEAATQATYDRLGDLACQALAAGYRVIVDATFLRAAERDGLRALALAEQVPFAILHCHAPQAVLAARIDARSLRHDDASEADLSVLRQQQDVVEPLRADELAVAINVSADSPFDVMQLTSHWLAIV